MNNITRETFEKMPVESKLDTLFDLASAQYKCTCDNSIKIESLTTRFDKRKKVDTTIAGGAGLVGGILAYIGEKFFIK